MNQITDGDIQEFVSLLLSLSGHSLNNNNIIIDEEGNESCVQDGDQCKPIQVIKPGMLMDDKNCFLNPFKSVSGNNPELTWFYLSRVKALAEMLRAIVVRVVHIAVIKETKEYSVLSLLDGISEQCDATLESELDKISPASYLNIFYNRTKKTAEAQCQIFTDDIESSYKFRKKTWPIARTIIRKILGMKEDENTLSSFTYRANVLSIPDIDAKLHVIGMIIDALDPWTNLIGVTLPKEEFHKHLENLPVYAKACKWFTAKISGDKKIICSNAEPRGLPIRDVQPPSVPMNPTMTPPPPSLPAPTVTPISVPSNPTMAAPIMPPQVPYGSPYPAQVPYQSYAPTIRPLQPSPVPIFPVKPMYNYQTPYMQAPGYYPQVVAPPTVPTVYGQSPVYSVPQPPPLIRQQPGENPHIRIKNF